MRRTNFILAVLWLFVPVALPGQEAHFAASDNQHPVHQMLYNPSLIVDQRPWLDVEWLSLGVFAANNVAFASKDKLLQAQLDSNFIQFNTDINHLWGLVNVAARGLSGSMSLGKQAVGFHAAVRVYGSANRVPAIISYILTSQRIDRVDSSLFQARQAKGAALAWAEFGLSYGRMVYHFSHDIVSVGLTLNRLQALSSNAVYIARGTSQMVRDTGLLVTGKGAYAYSAVSLSAGGGWSGSIGLTYKRMIDDVNGYDPHSVSARCTTMPYRFRLSLAVIDLGAVRIKKNALYNFFQDGDRLTPYFDNLGGTGLIDPSSVPSDGNSFLATTPAAVHFGADYFFRSGFFVGGSWQQRIGLRSSLGPERANLLGVCPRYERRQFGVGLPVSLLHYRRAQVGIGVRLGPLTIGTDNLWPILFQDALYGGDFYFQIHTRFHRGLACRKQGIGKGEGFRFKDVFRLRHPSIEHCPEW